MQVNGKIKKSIKKLYTSGSSSSSRGSHRIVFTPLGVYMLALCVDFKEVTLR